jgi:hypothetical protein
MDLSKSLLKLVEYGEPFSIINTLFGYALSATGIPPSDRAAFDLKQKFTTIQELLYDRIISEESVTLVVIDSLEAGRAQEGERERVERFLITLTVDF